MNSVFILLNSLNDWKPYCETDSLMTVTDFLEHRYGERTPKLVINLSDEYGYNSEGYYCSLLAQARGHRVLPGVETLNKLESGAGIRMNRNLQQLCQQWIERNRITDETWQLNIYFGTCREKGLEKIARFIFDHYPCPILRVTMNNHARNQIESVQALSLRQLSESGQDDFANALDCFNKKVWRSPRSAKPARYNLAILYDPDEKFPPSDKDALNKFLEVARKMNIHAELITEEEATRLMEFDALFIRATTALNHYTFRLAQRAAMNDIAVIDDPESIIRCTNKVYLCELFEKARIPAPASQLLFRSNEYSFGEISERLGAPFILKIPDGSFSVGMHKVASDEELRAALDEMFRHSSVLLAQEFIPTEFDWRIGLLDGEPLFACKYYMAKGHWQIYNHAHDDTGRNLCGAWDNWGTKFPTWEVSGHTAHVARPDTATGWQARRMSAVTLPAGTYSVRVDITGTAGLAFEVHVGDRVAFYAGSDWRRFTLDQPTEVYVQLAVSPTWTGEATLTPVILEGDWTTT